MSIFSYLVQNEVRIFASILYQKYTIIIIQFYFKEFAFHSSTALSSDVNELIYEEYISFNLNKLPNYFKLQYRYGLISISLPVNNHTNQ